ncbi:MAG: alpha/beta fold hydrolase, partial [Chloroflexi bacterium]|nr:alpha/beta fold hydrolase [Chloroflexota bacterium]
MTTHTATDRYVSSSGLRLHCLDWGGGGATPLLLLHGLRGHAHTWDAVARRFADAYRVLALDLRGHGDSDWSRPGDYSAAARVADLGQWVEQLRLPPFLLMGHCLGGAVATVYAARHPDRVQALLLEDVSARAAGRDCSAFADAPLEFTSWAEAKAFWRDQRPLISDEALELWARHNLRELSSGCVGWKYDARALAAPQPDLWPHLRGLRCPTLLLRSAESECLSRETAEAMARANPCIRIAEVPDAGHAVHE